MISAFIFLGFFLGCKVDDISPIILKHFYDILQKLTDQYIKKIESLQREKEKVEANT
jgi:hypothetical protein